MVGWSTTPLGAFSGCGRTRGRYRYVRSGRGGQCARAQLHANTYNIAKFDDRDGPIPGEEPHSANCSFGSEAVIHVLARTLDMIQSLPFGQYHYAAAGGGGAVEGTGRMPASDLFGDKVRNEFGVFSVLARWVEVFFETSEIKMARSCKRG